MADAVRGRRLAATSIDAVLLVAPWAALAGLLSYHPAWGGLVGGMGDAVVVVAACLAGDAVLLVLQAVLWLAAGRTVGMGIVRIAVARGRPWLASILVVALVTVLGGAAGAAAVAAGSVDPQNAVALVLLGAKALDLAFVAGPTGRTLVDRMAGLQVAQAVPAPRPRVGAGITVDVALGVAVAMPALVALPDPSHLVGAAMGAGGALLALLALQAVSLAATRRTVGMRVVG